MKFFHYIFSSSKLDSFKRHERTISLCTDKYVGVSDGGVKFIKKYIYASYK